MRAASFDSRGSVQVKLVAVLDVEHKIPSIQILHDEEQVFLDVKTQRVRALFPETYFQWLPTCMQ